MSWHDPQSPWSRKLRRRIWLLAFSCVASLIAPIVVFTTLWRADALIRSTGTGGLPGNLFLALIAPLGLVSLVTIAALARRICIDCTVLKEVPKREGHLCPRCRTLLPKESPEGDCPSCLSAYTRSDLQSYWVDYVLEPQRLRPWGAHKSLRDKLFSGRELLRKNARANMAFQVPLLILALLFMWWLTGLSFTGVVFRYLPLFLAMALFGPGFMCLQRYRQRTGGAQHCAVCSYQQSPQGPNPDRCPECGADWSRAGGAIAGSPARNPRHLWMAIGLFSVSVMLFITHLTSQLPGSAWTLRALPTGALIRDTTTSGSFTRAEWSELQRRQLTREQTVQLAAGLLEKRLRRDYLDITEGGWLWTQVSTGTLPDDLVQRYYREMFEAWIDAPTRAAMHEAISVSLGSTFRSSHAPVGIDELVYFGGFFAGDDPTPMARKDGYTYPILLDDDPIQARIAPTHTGRLRLRAVLYFAVGPSLIRAKPPIQWHDDQTATLPPAATWSRRIELTRTIEIDD